MLVEPSLDDGAFEGSLFGVLAVDIFGDTGADLLVSPPCLASSDVGSAPLDGGRDMAGP